MSTSSKAPVGRTGKTPLYRSLYVQVLFAIVVGVLLWLVNTYIPMDGKIKSILNAVVVILVVIWLLQAFGIIGTLNIFHRPAAGTYYHRLFKLCYISK